MGKNQSLLANDEINENEQFSRTDWKRMNKTLKYNDQETIHFLKLQFDSNPTSLQIKLLFFVPGPIRWPFG